MNNSVKRVVTAVDENGKAVVAEESVVNPVQARGRQFYEVWGTEGELTSPVTTLKSGPAGSTFFPGPGGTRFGTITFPPTERGVGVEADEAEALPGLADQMEADNPAMHTTPTIDYDMVLSGTLTLELDDGVEVELPAGTCIIQQGTRHAWRNYGDTPAVLAYVMMDVRPS